MGKKSKLKKEIIIIGGGPAGISTAIWSKRLGYNPLIIESNSNLGGQLLNSYNKFIDCPGFYNLTGLEISAILADHVKKVGIEVIMNTSIKNFNLEVKLIHSDYEKIEADALVLALGVKKRKLNVPGEKDFLRLGVSDSVMRDVALYKGNPVTIVGGGDSAFEESLILANNGCNVTLVHHSDQFKARPIYQNQVFKNPNIKVLTHSQVTRIIGDSKVTSVEIKKVLPEHSLASEIFILPTCCIFPAIGSIASTELLVGQINLDKDGFIVTSECGETSMSGVWAVGDVCRPLLPSLSTALGSGALTAKSISEKLINNIL